MPRRGDRRGVWGLRLTMFLVFTGGATLIGAGAVVIYPYATAVYSDDRYRAQRARDDILNETTDRWKTRALIGGAIGLGASSLFLLVRKPTAKG
ncbi:MAG: hypothetical protein AAF593_01145 [Planctomycetota bacterium]